MSAIDDEAFECPQGEGDSGCICPEGRLNDRCRAECRWCFPLEQAEGQLGLGVISPDATGNTQSSSVKV